ncbi:hypothetical protein SNEBB_006288 [Seison nebaliae]|nr:hypothetical protein SNEBB_006288 [Seison nebaliae]
MTKKHRHDEEIDREENREKNQQAYKVYKWKRRRGNRQKHRIKPLNENLCRQICRNRELNRLRDEVVEYHNHLLKYHQKLGKRRCEQFQKYDHCPKCPKKKKKKKEKEKEVGSSDSSIISIGPTLNFIDDCCGGIDRFLTLEWLRRMIKHFKEILRRIFSISNRRKRILLCYLIVGLICIWFFQRVYKQKLLARATLLLPPTLNNDDYDYPRKYPPI